MRKSLFRNGQSIHRSGMRHFRFPLPDTLRMSPSPQDPTKWRLHAQSAAANAIMFDRTSGLSCDECLQLCISKYQARVN